MGFKKRPTIARRSRPIRRRTVTVAAPTTADSSRVDIDTLDEAEPSEQTNTAQASALEDAESPASEISSVQGESEAPVEERREAPDDVAPDDVAPDAPDHVAPNHVAPNHVAPNHVAPDHVAPDHVAPDHVAPNHVAPNHVAPDHVAPNHVAPNHVAGESRDDAAPEDAAGESVEVIADSARDTAIEVTEDPEDSADGAEEVAPADPIADDASGDAAEASDSAVIEDRDDGEREADTLEDDGTVSSSASHTDDVEDTGEGAGADKDGEAESDAGDDAVEADDRAGESEGDTQTDNADSDDGADSDSVAELNAAAAREEVVAEDDDDNDDDDDGDYGRFTPSYQVSPSDWLTPADEESEDEAEAGLVQSGPASIEEYVVELDESISAIVLRLAEIIRDVAPNAEETIRWGMPHYAQSGHLVYIDAKQDHVNLGFFRGDELADHEDARNLLQGAGGKLRHIRLYSVHSIAESQIRSLITAAVGLNRDISDL